MSRHAYYVFVTFIVSRSFLVFFMESQPQNIPILFTHIRMGLFNVVSVDKKLVSIFYVFSFPVIKPNVSEATYLLLSRLCLYLVIPSYYSIYSICSRLYILKYTESIRGSWYTKQEQTFYFFWPCFIFMQLITADSIGGVVLEFSHNMQKSMNLCMPISTYKQKPLIHFCSTIFVPTVPTPMILISKTVVFLSVMASDTASKYMDSPQLNLILCMQFQL